MGWFRRSGLTEEQVRKIVSETIADAVRQLGAGAQQSGNQALAEAVNGFLGKAIEAQAANLGAMGTFVEKMGDLSIRRAAAALGSRGGRERVRREAVRKAQLNPQFDCAVCRDPLSHDGQAILRHVNERHDARRQAAISNEAIIEHQRFLEQNGGRGN
jgi:hypothetical protein